MQPFSCQHREQHISKQNYKLSQYRRIIFPDQNHKDGPLVLLYYILFKVYIWDLALSLTFSVYIFLSYEKLKQFVETFPPYNHNTYLRGTVMYVQYFFFTFDVCHAQINSVLTRKGAGLYSHSSAQHWVKITCVYYIRSKQGRRQFNNIIQRYRTD